LLLNKLITDPAKNIDLLELMYVCLALGFQGRYRVETDGAATLEAVRENLYRTIRNCRGDFETALSPRWEGLDRTLEGKGSRFPAWAMLAIALAVTGLAYGGFRYSLVEAREDLSLSRVSESGTQPRLIPDNRLTMQPPVRRYADERPDRISLKPFLEEEIRQGLVTVDEDRPDYILVRVPGENLFASGQETVSSQYVPIINRIGEELTRTRGRIKVTGHTDSVPMREPGPFEVRRFPSNRSLSQARAEEVVKILAAHVDATRLSAIGMADEAPLPGTSGAEPENRRVEIQVLERRKGG
jgi:type VI secretion system protein ImpK